MFGCTNSRKQQCREAWPWPAISHAKKIQSISIFIFISPLINLIIFIFCFLITLKKSYNLWASEMASLSLSLPLSTKPSTLSNHLNSKTPKPPISQTLMLGPGSSQSQFYGLKLSTSLSYKTPSAPFQRNSIFAKVTKGKTPPPFTLKDQEGRSVSLSKFKGKPVVVYFYPADETPGCTKQACAFRDSYEKFKKAGAEVVGISGDSADSHKAFAKKYKLPFTLLSDEGNKVRKEWGVPSDLFGTLPGRETYVLDKNGVVQLVYNNQFQPEKHIDETLKLLQSLK